METAEVVEQVEVKVGTIFDSSWGYDQTNIDFYEVVKHTIGKSGIEWVTVQKIGQHLDDQGPAGHDYVVPNRTVKVGKPFRRKLHRYRSGAGFSPESYSWASIWSGDARYQTAVGWGH